MSRFMPSCGKQLLALKDSNLKFGPAHLQSKPQGMAPTPLVPISLSTGVDFVSDRPPIFKRSRHLVVVACFWCVQDLLDVNTLELARQLTIAFSGLLRDIRVNNDDNNNNNC